MQTKIDIDTAKARYSKGYAYRAGAFGIVTQEYAEPEEACRKLMSDLREKYEAMKKIGAAMLTDDGRTLFEQLKQLFGS